MVGGRVERLRVVLRVYPALGVGVGRGPGDDQGAVICLVTEMMTTHLLQDEGIARNLSRNDAENRGFRVEFLLHAKRLHEVA